MVRSFIGLAVKIITAQDRCQGRMQGHILAKQSQLSAAFDRSLKGIVLGAKNVKGLEINLSP
jgi:hypothetical protein